MKRLLTSVRADPEKFYGFTKFGTQLNEITELEDGKMAPSDSRLRPDQSAMEVRPAETQSAARSETDRVVPCSEATLMLPRNSRRSSKRSSEPSAKRRKTKAATRPRQCGSRRKVKSGSMAAITVSRAHTLGASRGTLADEAFPPAVEKREKKDWQDPDIFVEA